MAMATCELETVLKGDFSGVTKETFEIVVTRYNEPLEWTRGIEHLCTVYNKGAEFEYDGLVKNVPNHGMGCEAMLRHICQNYWRLADVTFFAQATLCDRSDQPLYPLEVYKGCGIDSVVAYKDELNEPPKSRYLFRILNEGCKSVDDLTFGEWRKKIGIPYKVAYESWVKGDWIAVGAKRVRRRPLSFYENLYSTCQFERGVCVEENWFMERTFYSLFS
jgi:hypothetical protein